MKRIESERNIEAAIKADIYSVERLEEYATFLATQLDVSDSFKLAQPLLKRTRDNGAKLLNCYRTLTQAIHDKEEISPAAIWLTDNFHIVEEQLREIHEDLPPKFYRELPRIALGELAGFPRIYAVALALVAHTDSQLELETIRRFVAAYQTVVPLTIGELWALAITLRLVLVENLRRISLSVVADHHKTKSANDFTDRLFELMGDHGLMQAHLHQLPHHDYPHVERDCAYLAQIAKRLRDQEAELWPALEYLEKLLENKKSSKDQVVHLSHQRQASNQVTIANIITSMRLLSSIDWRDFFESLSRVDRVLEEDPIYPQMDFLTRDRYRHVIERIGKRTHVGEVEVARTVVQFAHQNPPGTKSSHVGYYLIGRGIKKLEDHFGKKSILCNLDHLVAHPHLVYFGLIGIFLFAACSFLLTYSARMGATNAQLALIGLLVLIPCSDLALSLANLILTHLIRPKRLPRLDFSSGIPPHGKSMVVIPCLLTGHPVVHELLSKLEIHYLGNSDPELYFSLLADFTDAQQENMPDDESLLQAAQEGVDQLNRKYSKEGPLRFFVFCRQRKWSRSENTWMGYERKRGKIEEFNRLLRGARDTSFLKSPASYEFLSTIRYVITLDADTQLPREAASKLIGTILHPLNQAVFDKEKKRVVDGYGILQPRIGISLESSNRSFFARIYSGHTGFDPYTTAVSEVYQDLFQEGCYTGKGLYDVDAFEASLHNRAPENTILSHDLFEGLFTRTALLTDVELLDDYPQTYHSFFTRQHRWVRGDWQIARWIFPFIKNARHQSIRNDLPLISRWKIFDNLRRSLVAPTTFLWLVVAHGLLPGSSLFWTFAALFIIFSPSIFQTFLAAIKLRWRKHSLHMATAKLKNRTNLIRPFFHLAFLAHQAVIHLDAIIRVFYRVSISNEKMLEWTSAAQVERQGFGKRSPLWQTPWPTELTLFTIALFFLFSPSGPLSLSGALVLLWMIYPWVAERISRKHLRQRLSLTFSERLIMREVARRTWHYFETYVGPEDHFLPPDNHQEYPEPRTAHRTSPTNMGLYILALVSAHDFGHLSTFQFLRRLRETLATLQELEKFRGHFFNWYDTQSLQVLHPKYISTVDSGNLAGYFLAGRQACLDLSTEPLVSGKLLDGVRDSLTILERDARTLSFCPSSLTEAMVQCQRQLVEPEQNTFSAWNHQLQNIQASLTHLQACLKRLKAEPSSPDFTIIQGMLVWPRQSCGLLQSVREDILLLAPWTKTQLGAREAELDQNVPLAQLPKAYIKAHSWGIDLGQAEMALAQFFDEAQSAAQLQDDFFNAMDFDFLLDQDKGIFSIGFNVTDSRFDAGMYDLLGSESRLASFVAVAKGDAPQEHWFRLGRQLVPLHGSRALISWSASMFEYLMPLLVMRDYENTLLEETTQAVVARQISYGHEHHVPWGVSEAGYNGRDLQLNYQYGPFGIPGLGLKRGLGHELVISPYSTFLAAMVDPLAAIKNTKALIQQGLLSRFGFYESIDYTSSRLPDNQKFAIIKSFMAHHQGMSLVAINNVVNHRIMQNRFHADARVAATRLLLQERIPQGVVPFLPKVAEIELESEKKPTDRSLVRNYSDPRHSGPRVQILSNGTYSLMISTAGGGYSKCDGLAVTRWKEDPTRDNWGSYVFVKNCTTGRVWSSTCQPFNQIPSEYNVTFAEDKVEFHRRDGEISTHTQILVAPEDNAEIRHITLTNHSGSAYTVELTSYLEPVLGPMANDLDHLAFSKLFIQTEFLASKKSLIATRRKRSAHDRETYGFHVVVADQELLTDVQYETNRALFIGRGRTLHRPYALTPNHQLSNSSGATLDPILSLRVKVSIPAQGKVQIAFTTGLSTTHDQALEMADRYHDIHSFDREAKLAWTKAQADLRHLDLDTETAYLFQRIAQYILYSEPTLRPSSERRSHDTNIQSSLWPSGISGDLPIMAIRISAQRNMGIIRRLLRCHEYLRLKGLSYDFVIINERENTYFQDLQSELTQQVRTTGSQAWLNKRGGIFILRRDITPAKEIAHIQAVARLSLTADQTLAEQINRKSPEDKYPPSLTPRAIPLQYPVETLEPVSLEFSNGFGGFTPDGREYVIQLRPGQWTPAPWINVVANKMGFGFQVSESGSGFTWSENAQSNRLTPWSNDPVCDPPGEIIYLRDDDTGEIWTPTPLPIRSDSPYVIRHGQGYTTFEHASHGLQHTLSLFIPPEDPIKISLLTLKNTTDKPRRLSLTSYTEWVLGTQREKTATFIVCDVDRESGAIFAHNPHDMEFSSRVSFADISSLDRTYTCSRKEFIGRNGHYERPTALARRGLAGKRGTGQDPCAVLQTSFELAPGEQHEIAILLGQSVDLQSARQLALRYRDLSTIKSAHAEALRSWDDVLHQVQVKTPDRAMDLLMNRWLLYQNLSCRYWGRTAFYQSGGAYGFRDQLQDCMAFVYSVPELARAHIIRASTRQFKEGDVQHWWHPPTGRGVRTRMSDDLLWLPYVVSFYVRVTNDTGLLSEITPFLEGPLLKPEQEDSYFMPKVSEERASIFEHCVRAIERSLPLGKHGLPLMGAGDWNDGMNRVGIQGTGESIWLGWFLCRVLEDFTPLCHPELKEKYSAHAQSLKQCLEKDGWDGDWYKRAYYDDGTPLGSATNEECRIDSISQSWAILSGGCDPRRGQRALAKVNELLVRKRSQLVLLFTPPFDKSPKDPGYIKGYVPGVRENGGQYTHAAVWVAMAYAAAGNGRQAFAILNMLNPILHSSDQAQATLYRTEPYALTGDVYSGDAYEGRGGWSWYTGSAAWYYRAGLESLLGFQLRGDHLKISPCIPTEWEEFEIIYQHKKTIYYIKVLNPHRLSTGTSKYELDGAPISKAGLDLIPDGRSHHIVITLQPSSRSDENEKQTVNREGQDDSAHP